MLATQTAKPKTVVFTGAGVSAESGLPTFRGSDGLWENHPVTQVACPQAWAADPEMVLRFYNQRRRALAKVEPNAAHRAIASLEAHCETLVITQNIDDLHERAGSTSVLHLHGEITKARSSWRDHLVYDIGYRDLELGETCELNSQLRPHVVWFGEIPLLLDQACDAIASADRVLVVGTSLQVQPAAGLLGFAPPDAEKIMITLEPGHHPDGFELRQGRASQLVPAVVSHWVGAI